MATSPNENSSPPVWTGKLSPSFHQPPPIRPPGSRPPPVLPPVKNFSRSLLTPAELERFGNLLLFARSKVEGYFAGKHKSPHRGSSVEFTDYKEYLPGDDLKHIDWRAYGRSRRLYVRRYEAETDMLIYLLVDVSGSMAYTGTGPQSKYVLAAKIAAALSYLMINQGDKVALGTFADSMRRFLRAGGTRQHLHNLLGQLEIIVPIARTGIAKALTECDTLFKKRGRIVILSDFWDDPGPMFEALSRFRHRKFEVLLLQIVHPDELDLPDVAAARFQDMETHEEVEVETEEIRAAYRETARRRIDLLAREAHSRLISHALVRADQPYLDAIEGYLGFRGNNTFAGC